MPIKIFYDNFELADGVNPQAVKQLMARDASWGTHVESLVAVSHTIGESSVGRWRAFEPRVINTAHGLAADERFTLEFPDTSFDFDSEGVDHFVATVAGDILLQSTMLNIRVQDFELTNPDLFSAFPGPNIGVQGLYESLLQPSLKGTDRPIVAFTVKPRIGLNVAEYVQIYKEAASAGIDIIEDDERLIDPRNCRFEERVCALANAQKNFCAIYSPNITGDSMSALDRLEFSVKHGCAWSNAM